MTMVPPYTTDEAAFKWISDHLITHKLQFGLAALLSPCILYLMFSQLEKYPQNDKIAFRVGIIFLSGYFVASCIAYTSQVILVPKLIQAGLLEQARIWYFNSPVSIAYFINQFGYCAWGIGTIILFIKFIKKEGFIKYLSIIYLLSGLLSIIAFTGLIVDNKCMNSMTLYSGLVLIPVGIVSVIWGMKENNKSTSTQTEGVDKLR
jgi:hypothetical protein